jgi:predicted MPP superfamily phosphohydrolase
MHMIWLTDIHLDHLFPHERRKFFLSLGRNDSQPVVVLVGGDISKASCLEDDLRAIQKATKAQVYFVLGNHDYFGSSFSAVHDIIGRLTRERNCLHWLENISHVSIMKDVALVGYGCWGDTRIGSYWKSELHRDMPDFFEIADLKALNRYERLQFLKNSGEKAAKHLREACISAAKEHSHVIILAHVPPFPHAIMRDGNKDDSGLPFFCCLAAGRTIQELAETCPYVRFTVLSGHTHQESSILLRQNLESIVQEAQYHRPQVRVLTLENGKLI